MRYHSFCCGMIAMKREVAVGEQSPTGFPWSECQEPDEAQETDDKSLYKR